MTSLGSGLVRLEPYVRPKGEITAMRVLKIVNPVKDLIEDYDGYVQRPTEGSLIQRLGSFPVIDLNISMKDVAVLSHNLEDIP
jgi:hypothetical protein